MIDLKEIVNKNKINYDVVCEVGVYKYEESHVKNLISSSKKIILIEANPKICEELKEKTKKDNNVFVFNYAVYKENSKKIKLFDRKASSYIEGLKSPTVINKGYIPDEKDAFFVEAKTFDFFDDGNIDILSVDIEGAEWYVINKMISRPKIICLETHSKLYDWQTYINPHINEINEWMKKNKYKEYTNDISDTIYIKS